MPKRTPSFDWDTLNRRKKAGKAEDAEAERATKAAQARREAVLRIIADDDEKHERERLNRIATANEPRQYTFSYPGMNEPRRVTAKGHHDFRVEPYQANQMICSKCGMSKWAADRDRLSCPDRLLTVR